MHFCSRCKISDTLKNWKLVPHFKGWLWEHTLVQEDGDICGWRERIPEKV